MKKNWKNILVWAALLGATGSFTACDLETPPTSSVDVESVFGSTSDAEMVLEGVWRYLLDANSGDRNPSWGTIRMTDDCMGNDIVETNRYGANTRYDFTDIYGRANSAGSLVWTLIYAGVNNANNVLDNIDDATGQTEDRNRIKGQAYGLRGYMYLELASHFSFAIDKDPNAVCAPIYTKTTDFAQASEGVAASSVSEVYAQAISDLENALELIPTNYARTAKYQMNRQVVLGLLSRANLYARNWQKALDYSEELLGLNHYLMTEEEWKSGFNQVSNNEWIWGHPQTADQHGYSQILNYLNTTETSSTYYSLMVDPYFRELYNDGDYRKDQIYWSPTPSQNPATATILWMRNEKFRYYDANSKYGDVVLLRSGEVYLINAEAKARLGQNSAAVARLNELRSARGAALASSSLSGDALVEEILVERRKELWGEGFSLVDIIRNQKAVERRDWPGTNFDYTWVDNNGVTQTRSIPTAGHRIINLPDGTPFVPNSKYYLWRIPNTEETANKHLYENYPRLSIYD
ncbi:MAG: RagB/SusD family nutrient uptake outer membrane protein [Bacteroidaceae bacterium]|nr:RagB/SusD family nutrient uptake outer membrane protein [Bacteroidaceae bacterium]